jgi:predicted methyltransferase
MSGKRIGRSLAVALLVAGASLHAAAPASNAAAVAKALADPGRAFQRGDDARRHPAELVGMSGVHAGQRVLDLIPGNGYWTRIFSTIVGSKGKVYAVWPEAYGKLAMGDVAKLKAIAADPHYGNVVVQVQPSVDLSAPEPLDLVWTSQNYHDYGDPFMGKPGTAAFAKMVYRLLKPGGIFVVIDHKSAPGHGIADTDSFHRIDPDTVIKEARAAGFEFAGKSDVLLNPKDPLTIPVFDKSIRGHTSQFAFKFRKPMK